MILNADPDDIFPPLCPVREYEWIQPWKCEMIYTDSGIAEQDCVFKTSFPEDGPEDTWVVSRYEPPYYIEFVGINFLRSIRYSIELTLQENGMTDVLWNHVVTGLSAEGDKYVDNLTNERFSEEMELSQKMIHHFLEPGEMLKINSRKIFKINLSQNVENCVNC